MLQYDEYRIFTSKEDWEKHYDASWKRLDDYPLDGNKPTEFPIAYKTYTSFDPRCGGGIKPIPLEKAKKAIIDDCKLTIEALNRKIEKIKNL